MLPKYKNSIYVASESELETRSYYNRLWMAVRNQGIPRRDWLDEIADAIRDFDGEILQSSGVPYCIPDVDGVFGDDPEMRWFGYYLQSQPKCNWPLRRCRKIERLRMLDLYFRITRPHVARHFGR